MNISLAKGRVAITPKTLLVLHEDGELRGWRGTVPMGPDELYGKEGWSANRPDAGRWIVESRWEHAKLVGHTLPRLDTKRCWGGGFQIKIR